VPRYTTTLRGGVRFIEREAAARKVPSTECTRLAGEMISSNEETAELAWFLPDQVPTLAFPYPAEVLRSGDRPAYFAWDPAWVRPPG